MFQTLTGMIDAAGALGDELRVISEDSPSDGRRLLCHLESMVQVGSQPGHTAHLCIHKGSGSRGRLRGAGAGRRPCECTDWGAVTLRASCLNIIGRGFQT